jgi:hypothetical protein
MGDGQDRRRRDVLVYAGLMAVAGVMAINLHVVKHMLTCRTLRGGLA